jgi:hypothetical protein
MAMGKKKDKSAKKNAEKSNKDELNQALAILAAKVEALSAQLDEVARQPGPEGPAGPQGPAGPRGPAGATSR